MTAVTTDGVGLALVCDGCGATVPGLGDTMYHWRLAWSFMRQRGWAGSRLAVGPHRCNRCEAGDVPVRPALTPLSTEDRPPWRAEVHESGDSAVVTLHGDLDLLIADLLGSLLADLDEHGRVLVDLADVPMIDSTVLGVLVRVHQERTTQGKGFALACPSAVVRRVLAVMCLDDLFVVLDDRGSAQAWAAAG